MRGYKMSAARDSGEARNAHDRDTIGDKSGTAEMQHVIKFFVGTLCTVMNVTGLFRETGVISGSLFGIRMQDRNDG
jgi:hypothetical protein